MHITLWHYPETILAPSDSRNQNGGHQTNEIGNRRGGVGSRIEYHMGHMAVTGDHISLSFGNNTASLSWPSGGHFVCLMTAILVYRLSKIMFASHREYMKILHGCYQNHESAALLLTIILFFGFYLGFTQNAMSDVLSNHTLFRAYPKPYYG